MSRRSGKLEAVQVLKQIATRRRTVYGEACMFVIGFFQAICAEKHGIRVQGDGRL